MRCFGANSKFPIFRRSCHAEHYELPPNAPCHGVMVASCIPGQRNVSRISGEADRQTDPVMIRALRLALFALSAIGLTTMVTSLFLQVLAREFNWRVDWTEEIGRFAFISMVFMAAAYSTLTHSHLRVSVFSDLVARKIGARPVQAFHTLFLLGFAAIMIYFSAVNFVEGLRFPNISPALRFNQNILFVAMCCGFALIFLLHLRDLWALMRGDTLEDGGPVNE